MSFFAAIGERNIEQYQNQELKRAFNEKDQTVQALTAQVAKKEQSVQAFTIENVMYATSNSWRLTRPLRKLFKVNKGKRNV